MQQGGKKGGNPASVKSDPELRTFGMGFVAEGAMSLEVSHYRLEEMVGTIRRRNPVGLLAFNR